MLKHRRNVHDDHKVMREEYAETACSEIDNPIFRRLECEIPQPMTEHERALKEEQRQADIYASRVYGPYI